jgi:NADPH-dependent 2,4-dienoyl-CoA reductase/sulfur reductase-like enzyme
VGFDGVELQFGLGYLVSQFLSAATNLRHDSYGGSPENRRRFAEEVFSSVRHETGTDFPISARISASEYAPDGLEIEDAKDLARLIETWGGDLIHIATGSNCDSLPWYFQHMSLPPGINEKLAARVHREIKVPLMVAGRMGDPLRIRAVLAQGMVDMVALGRPLLADPDLPRKMAEDRDDEVLLCGHCLQGCFANVRAGKGIGCNINPTVGCEQQPVTPATPSRRVVIVGAGPAGMQAALTAYRRGHNVIILEKNQLGGQFRLACLSPGKERMEKPLRSMIAQVERLDIDIRRGEEATPDRLESLDPDVVVVATGSRQAVPDIPGLDSPITAQEILGGSHNPGDNVLILGGGMVGIEVAEHLALRGTRVTVVEILDDVAQDMDPISRKLLLKRLTTLPVTIHTATELVRFEDGQAVVTQNDVRRRWGPFDTVAVATGSHPFDPLSGRLREAGITVKIIGDAAKPGTIYDAVRSGHEVAMSL